jgi:hypothetical protein
MIARLNNPGMFQSFWEMDEQGVDEESEEEIQSMAHHSIVYKIE